MALSEIPEALMLESWVQSPFPSQQQIESNLPQPKKSNENEFWGSRIPKSARVIGLYGVPGCGKTTCMEWLKKHFKYAPMLYYEGSDVIAKMIEGACQEPFQADIDTNDVLRHQALEKFRQADQKTQSHFRTLAIRYVAEQSASQGQPAAVTGHFMFWAESSLSGDTVFTHADLEIYTSIIYLEVPEEEVVLRRAQDRERQRESVSPRHIRRWQDTEQAHLRQLCRDHGILFSVTRRSTQNFDRLSALMRFHLDTAEANAACVVRSLDTLMEHDKDTQTILTFDADKTLASVDTGKLFWQLANERACSSTVDTYFKHPRWQYTHNAFRQAALLYDELDEQDTFELLCGAVAAKTVIHPEFLEILKRPPGHMKVLVVTCGLRLVWEKVLQQVSSSAEVALIGGGRVQDAFVVTAETKCNIVQHLQARYDLRVWVFGDSPLDIPMMEAANKAIVVVGEATTRSRSMDTALEDALEQGALRAKQLLLPSHAEPRLTVEQLPVVGNIREQIVADPHLRICHLTGNSSAKILMTAMRDATVSGLQLQEAHRVVGWYLATHFLPSLLGLEEKPIQHVQGRTVIGHRIKTEPRTTIVAMMRGGEPMAFGVHAAMPTARFLHAFSPEDVTPAYLREQATVILVDSVINTGRSIAHSIRHIRENAPHMTVVVISGVAHDASLRRGSFICRESSSGTITVISLRLSQNTFQGRHQTDTGNRLFQTTHIE